MHNARTHTDTHTLSHHAKRFDINFLAEQILLHEFI